MFKKIAFIIWCIMSLLILFSWLGHAGEEGVQIALGYPLIAINFPISLGVAWLYGFLRYWLDTTIAQTAFPAMLSIIADWAVFTSAGFVQWFLLIPWLAKKI